MKNFNVNADSGANVDTDANANADEGDSTWALLDFVQPR